MTYKITHDGTNLVVDSVAGYISFKGAGTESFRVDAAEVSLRTGIELAFYNVGEDEHGEIYRDDDYLYIDSGTGGSTKLYVGGVDFALLGANQFRIQDAAGSFNNYTDLYSATSTDQYYLTFRRSHNDTLATVTATVTTEKLGAIEWLGADSGNSFDFGANIRAVQNGAAGAKVPTDLIFETYSSTAVNTDQFKLMNDGTTRIGGTSHYSAFAADGILTMTGTARVVKSVWLPAEALQSAGVKPAAVGVNDNGYVVMTFADNAEKEIQFNMKIPEDCDDTVDVTICVGWSSPTADPGDDSKQADWVLTHLETAVGESTDAAGTAESDVLASSSTTANGLVVTTVGTINIGSDDVCIHCKLMRDGDNANDTLGDAVEVHGVTLIYTSNKLGTAT